MGAQPESSCGGAVVEPTELAHPGIGPLRSIPDELRRRYQSNNWWTNQTLGELLADGLTRAATQRFRVHSETRPYSATVGEVEIVARRLAAGLRRRGVGPGDVVAFQLPNWMEAAATFWAAALVGAVVVPIVHFYGPKELAFILSATSPRVFVTAKQFGRMTFHPDTCTGVPIVGVVGENFAELLAPEPMSGTVECDSAAPVLIAFTSGTTRNPKGVIHSHQTLGFETRQLSANYPSDRGPLLTALPVGHFIGMVSAFLIPVLDGSAIEMCDAWDPARVLALMDSDGLSIGGGPPYFVTSLLDHPDFRDDHLRYIKYVGLGGSTVPAAVTRRLTDLGVVVTRSYGSTEHPSITGSAVTAAEQKRLLTDGDPRPGVEIRIGADGEIFSRGPDLCLGYTDPELTAAAFDREGWYRTGDIGVLDAEGYLTITDRKSDVIIRGGENISALEVEEALLTLPAVAEAVVVAMPDPRLGERPAAVLRLRQGQAMPTLQQVREHFEQLGMARQKWPERLHQVADFPRTASGKVQKYIIRHNLSTNSTAPERAGT